MLPDSKPRNHILLRFGMVVIILALLSQTALVVGQSYTFQVQSGTPVYLQNFAHVEKGCNWMGIAGQVFDQSGLPIDRMVVRVEGFLGNQTIDALGMTSLATAYGPGGYEIELAQKVLNSNGTLNITLYDLQGQQVSAHVPFTTYMDCSKNLIIINFIQTSAPSMPTTTPTGTFSGVTVNGSLLLQGRPAAPHSSWVTAMKLDLIPPGQNQAAATYNTTTDQNGQYSVPNVPAGTYKIGVKGENTLRTTIPVTTLQSGSNQLPAITLKAGDANNDNYVSAADFSILAGAFGKCLGTGGYNGKADFNSDQCVTAADFSLLSGNYGLQGD